MAFDDPRILNKLFGWQIAKRVRSLTASAVIAGFEKDRDTARGEVCLGAGKWNCTLRQLSPTLIEGTCTCPIYRREQMLCEHIGLLYLAACGEVKTTEERSSSLEKQKINVEEKKGGAIPYRLYLPENWRTLWEKPTLPVRCEKRGEEEDQDDSDNSLKSWFTSQGVCTPPPVFVLPRDVREPFFRSMAGHKNIFAGKDKLHIEDQTPLFLLEVKKTTDGDWTLKPHLPEGIIPWKDYFFHEKRNILYLPAQAAVPVGWKVETWLSLLSGLPVKVTGDVVLRSRGVLSEFFQIREEEENLFHIDCLNPVFSLSLEGMGDFLKLVAFADYGEEGDFPLIPSEAGREDPRPWGDRNRQGCWQRNTDRENAFIRDLQSASFQFSPRGWMLNGEEQVMDFWLEVLPRWQKRIDCRMTLSQELEKEMKNWARVTPVLVPEAGKGDWMEASFLFTHGNGEYIPSSEILKLIKSGKKKIRLNNGQTGIIDTNAAEDWTQLMAETEVEQYSPGEFRFSSRSLPVFQSLIEPSPDAPVSLAQNGDWESAFEVIRKECRVTLRPYQVEGVRWMWQRLLQAKGALLGDDMGLGKTIQTLALFIALRETCPEWKKRPSLIVAPASLLHNWQREAERAFPSLRCKILHGNGREEEEIEDLGITTYALLSRDFARHKRARYALMAFDEASFIRNPDTDAAEALRRIPADCKLALTGTPIENGVRDLWSVFEVVLPGYLGSRKAFYDLYEKPMASPDFDSSLLRRLRHRVSPWILRRTKGEVTPELPPKMISIRWCELHQEHKSLYHNLLREGVAQISDARRKQGREAARMIMLTVLLRLRQLCDDSRLLNLKTDRAPKPSSKMESFLELIDELIENDHKALVFSQFTSFLQLAGKELEKKGIPYLLLDGSTRNRGELVERFNHTSGPPVFLISLKAGGYGLNLQSADTVIHLDPWWNPAVEAQATDRAHRLGQLRPVNVYKFITTGTVEEKILSLQDRKKDILAAAFDENRPLMSGLNEKEISDLLDIF